MSDAEELKHRYELQVTANKMLCVRLDSLEARLELVRDEALEEAAKLVMESATQWQAAEKIRALKGKK